MPRRRSHPAANRAANRADDATTVSVWSCDMQLGSFSISLAVKDLAKSRELYERLGFA